MGIGISDIINIAGFVISLFNTPRSNYYAPQQCVEAPKIVYVAPRVIADDVPYKRKDPRTPLQRERELKMASSDPAVVAKVTAEIIADFKKYAPTFED